METKKKIKVRKSRQIHYYMGNPVCMECNEVSIGKKELMKIDDIECCEKCYPKLRRLIEIKIRRENERKEYLAETKGF